MAHKVDEVDENVNGCDRHVVPMSQVVLSLASLVLLILGYRAVKKRWAHDLRVRELDEERRLRAPAERIWVSVAEREWPRLDEGTYRARVATVHNDSEGPARDLVVWWFLDGRATQPSPQDQAPSLAPGDIWALPEPSWITHMGPNHLITARLWFADLRDQHWESSDRGQVRLLREAVQEGYDFLDEASEVYLREVARNAPR